MRFFLTDAHTKRPRPSTGGAPALSEEGPASRALGMALRTGPGILCRWEQFDKKYLSQLLMRRSAYRIRDQIWDVYYRLNIRDAISFVDQVGRQPMVSGQVASRERQERETSRQALSRKLGIPSRLHGLMKWQLQ